MLYFSGTGNSRLVAEKFSENMGCRCHSIEEMLPFEAVIGSHDVIAFCYPVYGSRIPGIMRRFVRRYAKALKGKKVIIFCTQLIFSGDGARAFTDLLPAGHCRYIYGEHFRMPNNICNFFLFPIASGKRIRQRIGKTMVKLDRACEEIREGRIRLRGFHPLSRCLGLFQGLFWPSMEKSLADKVHIGAGCNKCGLCVRLCPVNNLSMGYHGVEAGKACICCYRCLNRCPRKAISGIFGKKVKKQYKGLGIAEFSEYARKKEEETEREKTGKAPCPDIRSDA